LKQQKADAGEVHTGPVLLHKFPFVNRGPESVEITEVRASCGCMKPRLDNRVYQPGEHGELTVEVNTLTQRAGLHTWFALCCYKTGTQAHELLLELSARLVTDVTVEPAELTIDGDQGRPQDLFLTDLRARPLSVTRVASISTGLKAAVVASYRDAYAHQVYKVRVEPGADLP